jgi:hypothetical protein
VDSTAALSPHKTFSNCSFILEVHLDRNVELGCSSWGFVIESSRYAFFFPLAFGVTTPAFVIDH